MPMDPFLLGGGALLAGLAGFSVGSLLQRSRAERQHLLVSMELEEVRAEAARLRTHAAQQDERLQTLGGVLGEQRQALARAEKLQAASQAREAELQKQHKQLEDTARLSSQQAEQLKGTQERLRQSERLVRLERDRARRLGDLLQQLGVAPDVQPHEPLEAAHRAPARVALARLLADTGADAAALVDGRGLALLGAGAPAAVAQLAAQGALLAQLTTAAEPSLGAPLRSGSFSGHSRGHHFLRVDSRRWLALAGPVQLPEQPLTLALLRLVGAPHAVSDASDQLYLGTPERAEDWRDTLGAAAADWCDRHGVDAAAILDAEGALLGATPGTLPRNLGVLHQGLCALHLRLHRDGWPLDAVRVRLRAADGATLSAQRLAARPEDPLLLTHARQDLSDPALDELAATLRWLLQTRPIPIAS